MFSSDAASVFVPDSVPIGDALNRTTALCFGAHQDDLEIMAYAPIVDCYGHDDKWFTGVTVTDGAGSPRSGVYAKYTDEQMKQVRAVEQNHAAAIGKYAAVVQLAHSSAAVKDTSNLAVVKDIARVIEMCGPDTVYTHNLADKHDTHVAVALRVIAAVRSLPAEKRPNKVVSLEVWRGLDWLCDDDKLPLDTAGHPNLAAALLGVFDSQIAGGKRYDLAALGRRTANATFFASHAVDNCDSMSYGLDITALIDNPALTPEEFIDAYIQKFRIEVLERIQRFAL